MKTLVKISVVFITCFFITATVFGQQTAKQVKEAAKASAIKSKIESKSYTFKADYAQPLRGGQRYLTSDYDLRVTKDSVISFLPYFGRTYMSAPLSSEESGVMFTSVKFDYKVQLKKKGGWTITITPANIKYISKLILDVYTNGTASLAVSSNYRDQIIFTGYIKE